MSFKQKNIDENRPNIVCAPGSRVQSLIAYLLGVLCAFLLQFIL